MVTTCTYVGFFLGGEAIGLDKMIVYQRLACHRE